MKERKRERIVVLMDLCVVLFFLVHSVWLYLGGVLFREMLVSPSLSCS